MAKKSEKAVARMRVCPYCLQEIISRGERVKEIENKTSEKAVFRCVWCDEKTPELYVIETDF